MGAEANRAIGAAEGMIVKATRPKLLGRQLRVIPFGDSISIGASTTNNTMWQYGSNYAETSLFLAGHRFQIIRNAGISGNTTTQMLARVQADVWDYSPDVVLLGGGTNDLSTGMVDSGYTTCFNNLEAIVVGCLNRGILPIIVTCPPKNGAVPESRKAQVFYYLLAKAYGLPLLDMFQICADASTGQYKTGYSDDGTHPNDTAIAAIAAVFGPALANIDALHSGPYLAAVSELTVGTFPNLIRNGSFAKVASSPTPDSWTVNAAGATQTIPAATAPYTGNTFTYAKASGAGVYALFGSGITGWSVGDNLVMSGRIKSSGRSGALTGFIMTLDATSGALRPMTTWKQDGDFVFSAEMVVPTGTLALTPKLFVNDVGTLEVNNLTVWNKTAALAIWSPRFAA